MNQQIDQAVSIYKEARHSGVSKAGAKRLVYERMPGFKDAITVGTSHAPAWARALTEAEKAVNANGDGELPMLFPHPGKIPAHFKGAAEFTRWVFIRWAERCKPVHIGQIYTFSPKQFADIIESITGRALTTVGFVNEFLASQDSKLRNAGWGFQTIDGSTHETYSVKITAVPLPPAPVPAPSPTNGNPPADIDRLIEEKVDAALARILAKYQ